MLGQIKNRMMRASRERKLDHFYSLYDGGSVLDVGVSARTRMASGNLFLKTFRGAPHLYTGLGVQNLSQMHEHYPGMRFVQYPGGRFPFADKEFDWVFSNAVIEHVGDHAAQIDFANEMLRVAHNVFFTTPNKHFPIETHTNVPLLHWNDNWFFKWCSRHRPNTTRQNLNLLSYRSLREIMEASSASAYTIYKNRLAFWPLTFTVVCSNEPPHAGGG